MILARRAAGESRTEATVDFLAHRDASDEKDLSLETGENVRK